MTEKILCPCCGAENNKADRYCNSCREVMRGSSFPKDFLLPILKSLGYFGFYYVVQSLVTTVYSVIAMLLNPQIFDVGGLPQAEIFDRVYDGMMEAIGRFMPDIGIVSAIVTILGYYLFFRIRKKSLVRELKIKPIRVTSAFAMFSFGVCALFFVSIGLTVLYSFLPDLSGYSNSEAIDQLLSGGNPVMQFINISIVTGIIEETIFRGLIYTSLKRNMSVPVAVIVSAVIFGIAHMNIEQFFYTALLGALMALVYEKYGSLIAPIIVHATFNGSNYLLGAFNFEHDMPYVALMILAAAGLIITAALVFFSNRVSLSKIKKER